MTHRDIIKHLVDIRRAKGLTQRIVADRMYCARQMVTSLETGRYIPQLDTLLRYAAAIGATLTIQETQ